MYYVPHRFLAAHIAHNLVCLTTHVYYLGYASLLSMPKCYLRIVKALVIVKFVSLPVEGDQMYSHDQAGDDEEEAPAKTEPESILIGQRKSERT